MNIRLLRPVDAMRDAKVRTVIVADSPFMLKILAQTLEKVGWFNLVGSATDVYQALRHVSAFSPELVLMDVHMPGLNGIQATRFMKRSEHPPVVILFSAHNNSVTKSLAEQVGADGFVSKGASFRHRLIGVLENLFGPSGGRRATSSSVRFRASLAGRPKRSTAYEHLKARAQSEI